MQYLDTKNYFKLYIKYKSKYNNLKNKIQNGGAGAAAEDKGEGKATEGTLSIPFDAGIFSRIGFSHTYNVIGRLIKMSEDEITTLDSKIGRDISALNSEYNFIFGNSADEEKFVNYLNDSDKSKDTSPIRTFLVEAVEYFTKVLTTQIQEGKVSDHSIIFHIIEGKRIVSLNLLDDTYGILTMLFGSIPYYARNLKGLYTWAITIALNNMRQERMKKIVELIISVNPEIICFQEVNLKMLQILKTLLATNQFDKFILNKSVDTYFYNKQTHERHQYRSIFYKESNVQLVNNLNQVVSGEITLTEKGQALLVYNNSLIVSLHISWRLNLNGNDRDGNSNMEQNYRKLGEFIKQTIDIAKSLPRFNINNIILIGDTNNTAENLRTAIEMSKQNQILKDIEYIIIESANPTFFTDLNGGDKIDNVISIKLYRQCYFY